ncbi:hypothetical protein GF373_16680, partial [bacterium]|nr:hypothetical protein [bacterium]
MENTELAAIFEEIANYLQIKGENPFKIRAYQNAARVLESLNESAAAIHQRGELEQIDGIGKAIAEKIAEALNTGRIPYHEELKATMPDGILDLLHVPNLGPKKVKLVWDQLGITTVPDLKAAAEAGQLQSLPGMGKKSEEKILRGIENLEQYAKRHLLGLTYPIAQEFMDRVKEVKGVETAEIAGSLRRGKETVGDVDILVAASNGEPVVEAFLDDNRITEIIAKGTTKTSVALKNGLHIDLRIVDRSEFGAALQYFTGSKEHNVKLREMAVRQGLKINEYGVFEIQTEKRIAGKTEEEVYQAIGFPHIAPELREGLDELERAQSNTLPKLIEKKDIKCALHNHTTASDGLLSLEELVKESRARGYKYIAVTDHSAGLGVANGLSEDRLKARIEEIHQLNDTLNDFRVLT